MIENIYVGVSDETKQAQKVYVGADNKASLLFEHFELPTIVTWADGTDEEIAAMLDAHYNNLINIHDYWSVGDERNIRVGSKNYPMVLLNEGGKELVTPINGHTECAFIVGFKNCVGSQQRMYSANTTIGWGGSAVRTYCNDTLYNLLSPLGIFKQHNNYVAYTYNSTSPTKYEDWFCLPSAKEVFGSDGITTSSGYTKANTNAEAKNNLLKYYETTSNRYKYSDASSPKIANYWTSSKTYTTSTSNRNNMCVVSYSQYGSVRLTISTSEVKNSSMYWVSYQGVI